MIAKVYHFTEDRRHPKLTFLREEADDPLAGTGTGEPDEADDDVDDADIAREAGQLVTRLESVVQNAQASHPFTLSDRHAVEAAVHFLRQLAEDGEDEAPLESRRRRRSRGVSLTERGTPRTARDQAAIFLGDTRNPPAPARKPARKAPPRPKTSLPKTAEEQWARLMR